MRRSKALRIGLTVVGMYLGLVYGCKVLVARIERFQQKQSSASALEVKKFQEEQRRRSAGWDAGAAERQHEAEITTAEKERERQLARDLEADIDRLVAERAIHSIDVDAGVMRMDPRVWMARSLESKQTLVALFSRYCINKGRSGRVRVLSDRDDTLLAEFNTTTGPHILH